MMNNPLVSVIITTYNGKNEWMSECLDSVFGQTYKNIEAIIVNDASTNNIGSFIKEYQKKHNIIYLKNKDNLGVSKSSNIGIKNSKGKYIARIDDDDIRNDKRKLEKQVKFLEDNPNYGLCGVEEIILINGEGKIINKMRNRISDIEIRNNILVGNQFTHSSILFRKEAVDKVGLYNEKYFAALDYDIICKIGLLYKFKNLEGISVSYRINNKGITQSKHSLQYKNARKIFFRNRNNFPNFTKALIIRLIYLMVPNRVIRFLSEVKHRLTKY